MKGCLECKSRTGIYCSTRHEGRRILGVLKEEDVGKIHHYFEGVKTYRAGCQCPDFTPKIPLPIVVIFNGEIIFERKN